MENKELNNEENIIKEETVTEVENNDLVINEEVVENDNLDQNVIEEMLTVEEVQEDSKTIKFLKRILASVADQIIAVALSLVSIILFDLILRLFGLYIADRQPIFLIIYVIVNILYSPICESTKLGKTIGKKVILK